MNYSKRLAYCKNNDTQIRIHTGNDTTQEIVDLNKASNINLIVNCHIRKVRNQDRHETYMEDLAKKKKDREFMSINSFLVLLELTQEEAKNKAYKFKKLHSIEYFKCEDLEIIIADINSKIIEDFSK